jgi:hypothetical protein
MGIIGSHVDLTSRRPGQQANYGKPVCPPETTVVDGWPGGRMANRFEWQGVLRYASAFCGKLRLCVRGRIRMSPKTSVQTDKSGNHDPEVINLEAYRVAREARNLEITLFWQRSNYFL